jgi:hypothetical protein
LLQYLTDNDAMYQALREFKIRNNLPLHGLDPVGDYLRKKQEQNKKEEE